MCELNKSIAECKSYPWDDLFNFSYYRSGGLMCYSCSQKVSMKVFNFIFFSIKTLKLFMWSSSVRFNYQFWYFWYLAKDLAFTKLRILRRASYPHQHSASFLAYVSFAKLTSLYCQVSHHLSFFYYFKYLFLYFCIYCLNHWHPQSMRPTFFLLPFILTYTNSKFI